MNGAASGRKNSGGAQRISIAILAMGGQGGGVLADWVVALAEAQGWAAQSTSVPGVAQRTGATIYYIEMAPMRAGAQPVFALMPTPGDVDVVMASELMEAGRSVLRGLVTPEQTTLIASTHRAFAVAEKETPGDGVGDPAVVSIATEFAARRLIAFDMEAVAKAEGSVISAAMFGALAATEALPFDRVAFESAIRASGTGVTSSLRAFAAAFDRTRRTSNRAGASFPGEAFRGDAGYGGPSRARSSGGAHSLDLSRIGASRCCSPECAVWSTISIPIMRSNISIASACCSTSIARMAGRRGASPSRPPPPNMSRSRWPTMTSRVSPTSRSANPAGRACASKLPPQRTRSSQRPSISIREPTSCAALCPGDGASGSRAGPQYSRRWIAWSTEDGASAPTP